MSRRTLESLGYVRIERRPKNTFLAIANWFLTIMVLISIAMIAGGISTNSTVLMLAGLGPAFCGFSVRLLAGWLQPTFYRHEHGISKRSRFLHRFLHFDEIANVAQGMTDYYGGARSRVVDWEFLPVAGTEAKPIRVRLHCGHGKGDEEIISLFDELVSRRARRLSDQLAAGERVEWTSFSNAMLALRPEGVEFRPDSMWGKNGAEFLPFESIADYGFNNGRFYMQSVNQKKPVFNEYVTWRPGFFPGYEVFRHKVAAARGR